MNLFGGYHLNGLFVGYFLMFLKVFLVTLQSGKMFGGMHKFQVVWGCMPDMPDIYLG